MGCCLGSCKRKSTKTEPNPKASSERAKASAVVFYDNLRIELDEFEIYRIRYLFYTIKVSEHEISNSLFHFMIEEGFFKRYQAELQRLKKFGMERSGDAAQNMLTHCFAVIWAHLDLIKNIHDPTYLNKKLKELATCHCLFHNLKVLIKIHDNLLYKFVKNEFDKYHHPSTLEALKKYLKIIGDRIIVLGLEHIETNGQASILNTLRLQRTSTTARANEKDKIQEMYVAGYISQQSEMSLTNDSYELATTSAASPSRTSRGRRK